MINRPIVIGALLGVIGASYLQQPHPSDPLGAVAMFAVIIGIILLAVGAFLPGRKNERR